MKIEIESRKNIKVRAQKPFPAHTALISITDFDDGFAVLKNKPEYRLQLKFDDVPGEIYNEIFNSYSTMTDTARTIKELHVLSDEQAEEIAAFVKSIYCKANTLICQCEFGQSRSAGLAAAIRQYLYEDGIEVFADDRYSPNKLVYKKTLTALGKSGIKRTD